MIKHGWWIIQVVLVVWIIGMCVLHPTVTEGSSMYPTIDSGDTIIYLKTAYLFAEPKRGDVISFDAEKLGKRVIKRVIGLPGETIEIQDCIVYIDGKELVNEPYVKIDSLMDSDPKLVPENCVYVLGDNRLVSLDSRSKSMGMIPFENIRGKVILHLKPIYWVINPLAQ